MNSRPDVILSVYFPPSSVPVKSGGSIPSEFYSGDASQELNTESIDENSELQTRYKLGVDGVSGFFGFIFGAGIDDDCQHVVSIVEKILANIRSKKTGQRIIINCNGYSRGAVAALLLAKKLGKFPLDMIEVNLALIDPVPGNSIISVKLDLFDMTLANQVIDLSDCHNLKRVCSIYHTRPSPDYFFSPVRPMYPQHVCIEENFVPDEHFKIGKGYGKISGQVAIYLKKFMELCGTVFWIILMNVIQRKTGLVVHSQICFLMKTKKQPDPVIHFPLPRRKFGLSDQTIPNHYSKILNLILMNTGWICLMQKQFI